MTRLVVSGYTEGGLVILPFLYLLIQKVFKNQLKKAL